MYAPPMMDVSGAHVRDCYCFEMRTWTGHVLIFFPGTTHISEHGQEKQCEKRKREYCTKGCALPCGYIMRNKLSVTTLTSLHVKRDVKRRADARKPS